MLVLRFSLKQHFVLHITKYTTSSGYYQPQKTRYSIFVKTYKFLPEKFSLFSACFFGVHYCCPKIYTRQNAV